MSESKTQLEQLSKLTSIVADTGEIEQIKLYTPEDATTNPSLILKAAGLKEYKHLIGDAISYTKEKNGGVDLCIDRLLVNFGSEILKIVPGVVSTEVDARLSFNTNATVEKAKKIIEMYKEKNIDKSRVLIKIASTYEGIKAAEILERDYDIHCNLTLLFSLIQAAACAEAKVWLISPFVGRITDWYKANENVDHYAAEDDPGVKSVSEIYAYYKSLGYKTIIMGASFRNVGQVLRLAGIDKLTLSPGILKTLSESNDEVVQYLFPNVKDDTITKFDTEESNFRYLLNENAMATEKLADGIRRFAADAFKLEGLLAKQL